MKRQEHCGSLEMKQVPGRILGRSLKEFDNQIVELASTTVLKDGTHIVSTLEPLEMSDKWVSPNTGKQYPTKFPMVIPGLSASFDIEVPYKEQEIISKVGGLTKFEGMMSVIGTMHGKLRTGEGYVEMVGRWQ